ncbi:iron uptake porin, partial [Nostoc piscinale]|uniref:iron uptake porin n=1 Tax=Nostoc piscinale TaxID=224012 RepID=UPI0039A69C86
MQKPLSYLLLISAVSSSIISISNTTFAGEISTTSEDKNQPLFVNSSEKPLENLHQEQTMAQVTSVSQLSDVQPTDWAFQALQSLVERYGCIAGYPNSTYRGNRALTRYEFAAGLNACLDRVNELLATATADLVTKEDLAKLQKLQEEFAAELATLRGRVDALEARTSELEANQFSTTTKLSGTAIFAPTSFFAGDRADGSNLDRGTSFGDRIRLDFNTSFTGKDLLRTRLQATNLNALSASTLTPEGDLRFTN